MPGISPENVGLRTWIFLAASCFFFLHVPLPAQCSGTFQTCLLCKTSLPSVCPGLWLCGCLRGNQVQVPRLGQGFCHLHSLLPAPQRAQGLVYSNRTCAWAAQWFAHSGALENRSKSGQSSGTCCLTFYLQSWGDSTHLRGATREEPPQTRSPCRWQLQCLSSRPLWRLPPAPFSFCISGQRAAHSL